MRTLHRPIRFVLLLGTAGLLAACGSDAGSTSTTGDGATQVSATFASGSGPAFTYDTARVPVGAKATVDASSGDGSTTTTLTVSGLNPNAMYGAHAHAKPCGATGDAAGPHFQMRQDPVTPSVDPAYANPSNEIWLDLTTDAQGAGTATSTVPWTFPDDRRARSVIIHEMPTKTEPGKAGTAGARPACVDVGF
ncbi:superoxide dismutase family protein [Pseudonocardia endophytica]|uniref:Cu-Zn family superoxide dismutase n=1 Tax=Pseudonocardia endophytica TaxID=401976 RepID=A0A4R1HWB8_PSEEN|nr:superoxide dismutase family protein [Pseudonocardia endophytica]TCK27044.1 Cu-Zn family superoxide dismutase [Pseudonocardia endophytica]